MTESPSAVCTDCGALVRDIDGPVHRYLGAVAGCWDLYTRTLAGDPPFGPTELSASMIDAYAAQHPGADVPPARQSVAVHLVALHARLRRGCDSSELNTIRVAAAQWGHSHGFGWLQPSPRQWPSTIADVVTASDDDRDAAVDRYVRGVYETWADSYESVIEGWYRAIIGGRRW